MIPIGTWLREELDRWRCDVLSPENVRRQGFFRPEVVTRLTRGPRRPQPDNSRKIWALLTFSLWHDSYGQGGSGSSAAADAALVAE